VATANAVKQIPPLFEYKFFLFRMLLRNLFGILVCTLLISISSCKQHKQEKYQSIPAGNFLNISFLEEMENHLPGEINHYCTEIILNSSDSAEFSNGFETFFLRMERRMDTLIFLDAFQSEGKLRNLKAVVKNQNEITVYDEVWTGKKEPTKFGKLDFDSNEKWKFSQALNKKLLIGEYTVLNVSKADTIVVEFKEDGSIKGWDNFTEFEICFAGDCLGESKEPGNLLYLHNLRGEVDAYLMNQLKQEGVIELFRLGNMRPEIKGEREKGELCFVMLNKINKKAGRQKGVF